MPDDQRRLSIGRRFSLADVAEGWQDCYVLYRPATPADMVEVKETNVKGIEPQEATDLLMKFLDNHFVGGQVLVANEPAPMQRQDLAELPDEILGELYLTIVGVNLDPKATPTVPSASSVPSNDESSTKTSSSTESAAEPTATS